MASQQEVKLEDVASVGTRVSWGAILAGAIIALAVNLLLTVFASAIGLSLDRHWVRNDAAVAWAAIIAAIFSICVGLFCGGWVCSLLTVGETRREAVIHGLLMWSAASFMTVWLVAMGFSTGYQALMAAAYGSNDPNASNWEKAAQAAGVPQQKIDEWRQSAQDAANNPDRAQRVAAIANWATLAGMLLSMASAIFGAITGAGPEFQLVTRRVGAVRRDGVLVGSP